MFNATYFKYDGILSSLYGLRIADFDDSNVKETEAFSPNLTLLKAPGQVRFFYGKIQYDSAPQCEFSVISEEALPGSARSIIMSWLIGRNQFKPLQFLDGDNSEFVYYCIFTSVKTIWVNGQCHGFRLTAQLDSPFARGPETTLTVQEGTHVVEFLNDSDVDGYVYPVVRFTGGNVDIVNITDDRNRHFTFSGLSADETITVDNEIRHIVSSAGGAKLDCFTSKKWMRLRRGKNSLRIVASGEVTITCPCYAMIGC